MLVLKSISQLFGLNATSPLARNEPIYQPRPESDPSQQGVLNVPLLEELWSPLTTVAAVGTALLLMVVLAVVLACRCRCRQLKYPGQVLSVAYPPPFAAAPYCMAQPYPSESYVTTYAAPIPFSEQYPLKAHLPDPESSHEPKRSEGESLDRLCCECYCEFSQTAESFGSVPGPNPPFIHH